MPSFRKPHPFPQAMLVATGIIPRTVHKYNNMTTLLRGGGAGRHFFLWFGNRPNILARIVVSVGTLHVHVFNRNGKERMVSFDMRAKIF